MLVIDDIGGASNLAYKLSLLSNSLCISYVLLDYDTSGRDAFEKASQKGLVSLKYCTFITCQGLKEAEFEDVLNLDLYLQAIINAFGVNLDIKQFRSSDKKWSERVKDTFLKQGKPWSDKIEAEIKMVVAECVKQQPNIALNPHKRSSIDALVTGLEEIVNVRK